MKKAIALLRPVVSLILVPAAVFSVAAQTNYTWTGAAGSDLNWSTPGNWTPPGPPGAADNAQFFDTGAASDTSTINNIVSGSLSINSLWYGQTNGVHNTQIAPGVTLTLGGASSLGHALLVGTETQPSSTEVVNATLSGAGGTLRIDSTNADLLIRQTHANSGSHSANLDLSGLDTFTANLGRVQVGVGNTTLRRATGNLILARTNTLTLWGASPQLLVSDNNGNNNGNSTLSAVTLGVQNRIFADTIRIGGQKCSGAMTLGSPGGSLYLRGSDGLSPLAEWDIGDNSSQSGSGNPSRGNVDLSAGTADILANTIYLGRGQTGNGGGGSAGFLTLGAGTLNVNTLEIAYQNSASAVGAVSGTVTVGSNGLFNAGAVVNVYSNLDMAHSAGSPAGITATLNINGGIVNVLGTLTHGGGSENYNVTNGLLNLPPHSSLPAGVVTVDGGVITNVDVLQASNSLVITHNGIIASPKVFDLGAAGTATWDVSALSGGLRVSNELSGAGSFYGDLTMAPGSVLVPGESGGVAPLYLLNNLTLDDATLRVDLSSSGFGGNDQLQVSGNLTLQGTNAVRLTALNGAFDTVNPYTLIAYSGGLTGGPENLQIAGAAAQSRYTFTFNTATPGAVQLQVGGSGPANLIWAGDGLTNSWDLKSSANWKNGATADKFYNLDNVVFDDTGSASPAVNLAGSVIPGSLTMSNNVQAYVFAGSGALGGGSLTNAGTGSLTIRNDGTNDFNVIDVENGRLTFAGGSANFSAGGLFVGLYSGTGSVIIANTNVNTFGGPGIYLNNGSLIFDQPADAEFATPVAGYGTLIKTNTNTLTWSGNNTGWASAINVVEGTLKVGAITAVENAGGVFVTNGGALDVNGQNLTASSIAITASGAGPGGTGALVNSGADQIHAFASLTLAGDTTFGGTGRWDLRGSSTSPALLNLNGGGYNLTKVGSNEVALVYCSVDPTLGNVDVQQGELAIQNTTVALAGFGDPTRTLTVHSGALLETYNLGGDASPLNKVIVLQDGAAIQNDNGPSTVSGPVTLEGNATFNVNAPFTFNNVLSGAGGLIKTGGSTLILSGADTYSGATLVSNGTLQVDGSLGGSGVDVAGGTLAGIGSIHAPVTVENNGVLSPGDNAIGTLVINGPLTLAGTCRMDVNKTGGVLTGDLITNVTTLALGGTLQLNLAGDVLTNGDSVTLFSAGAITGAFTNIVPPAPGAGLAWDTSQLSSGILKVTVAAPPAPMLGEVNLTGGHVTFRVTGGGAGGTFYLLTSTNVAAPLADWTPVATNQFDANGVFSFTNVPGAAPQEFFIIQMP